ncbi:IS1 family transposase, partial [Escherichia coli]
MASVSISCPSCSATDGVVRNGKSTALLTGWCVTAKAPP